MDVRRKRSLLRRRGYSKVPNYVCHIDSYDKLKLYAIAIIGCIHDFSRKIVWLHAGQLRTSSTPRIITDFMYKPSRNKWWLSIGLKRRHGD
ncbi:hypothetical protein HOLleu_13906 [Holothuria leucospilota]|uniref:Integrase core domain-containing protein n=1 Tax=Holothuria leucospilota TaxID=206669 RepID=A0A9Q1HBB3_HOLLE|nr:hypothetical protein HOLleu_13906 [Holothuria leucospilota]